MQVKSRPLPDYLKTPGDAKTLKVVYDSTTKLPDCLLAETVAWLWGQDQYNRIEVKLPQYALATSLTSGDTYMVLAKLKDNKDA